MAPAGTGSAKAKHPSDWPLFRGNAGATWANHHESTVTTATVRRLTPKWLRRVPSGSGWLLEKSGRLFSQCGTDVCAHSLKGNRRLWHSGCACVPVGVVDGRVFAYSTVDDQGYHGRMVAIDASSGHVLWRRKLQNAAVLLTVERNGLVYFKGFYGRLLALRQRDGHVVWHRNIGDGFGGPVALSGRTLIMAGGVVQAVDARTGRDLWRGAADFNGGAGPPVIADGMVLAGAGADGPANVAAWSVDGCGQSVCHPVWERVLGEGSMVNLAASGRTAYGVNYYDATTPGTLWAFDVRTGAVRWSAPTANGYGGVNANPNNVPVIAGGLLYVGTADGRLTAYHAGGCGQPHCHLVWQSHVDNPDGQISGPIVARGKVMVGGRGGLYAFGLRRAGTHPALPRPPATVQATADCNRVTVDFSTARNSTRWPTTAYKLRADDGTTVWTYPVGGPRQSGDIYPATSGHSYTVRVRTYSAAGHSAWSAPSNAATPEC